MTMTVVTTKVGDTVKRMWEDEHGIVIDMTHEDTSLSVKWDDGRTEEVYYTEVWKCRS